MLFPRNGQPTIGPDSKRIKTSVRAPFSLKFCFMPLCPIFSFSAYTGIGCLNRENVLAGLYGYSLAVFTRPEGLNWTPQELEVLLARVRTDVKNTDIHAYFRV